METNLHNSQINTITNDLNSSFKGTDSALNAISSLRNKSTETLSRPDISELEEACSIYQTNSNLYNPSPAQVSQDNLNTHQLNRSLYNIIWENERTNLYIYNTQTESQESKILQTPDALDRATCITQLPNSKLFCYGNSNFSGITVLIDENGGVEVLPSGIPCRWSSCIYFNKSVYCFGGEEEGFPLTLSSKFDLEQNRWSQLTPMPKVDECCHSIIFNGKILISGYNNRNLLSYSVDIDSFSTIPYEFEDMKRKILINAERLYLIEFDGLIYESEIGSDMNWSRIIESKIDFDPSQVYCSYNKGGIYIGIGGYNYYKFDLNEKRVTKLE